jgi:hypothetical protein
MRDARLFKFSLSLVTPYPPKLSNSEQRPHRESCILVFLMAGDSRWRERVDCDWQRSNEKKALLVLASVQGSSKRELALRIFISSWGFWLTPPECLRQDRCATEFSA